MLLTIKDVARQCQIKPSTLYAWVAAHKIPFLRIHGVIRFKPEEIAAWLESFRPQQTHGILAPKRMTTDLEELIARAKREVYSFRPGDQTESAPKGGTADGSL